MKRLTKGLLIVPALGLAMPLPSAAKWTLSGSNTFRVDSYHVDGDKSHSPYQDEGTFISNDVDLHAVGDTAPGETWRLDFGGTITDSPYRSEHKGMVPELMRMQYDNKTAPVPFRVDLGDQNVNLSELTLNRTLKAGRVTVSPNSGSDGRSYWVSGMVGTNGQAWSDFDADKDLYQAVSVGMQDRRLGRYGINVVHNSQNGLLGLPSLSQWVIGLTGGRKFDVAGHDLNVRGEVAHFRGDSRATAYLPEDERKDSGYGYFLQIDGRSQTKPLDYRLRYDRYSSGFRPNGSSAPADSEAMLAEGGWRFKNGVQMRGRLQRARNDVSTANPLTTDSASISLNGPLLPSQPDRIIGRLDLSMQQRKNESGSIDGTAQTAQVSAAIKHSSRHQTNVAASVATVDDNNLPGTEQISRQARVGHTANVTVGGLDLSLTPGVAVSEVETRDVELTTGPTLAVEAVRDRERLVLELGQSELDAADPEDSSERTQFSLKYEVKRGQHAFGVDVDRTVRDPAVGEETDAWRAGMYWRYDLGNDLSGAG